MPLTPQMYCAEQIFMTNMYTHQLKMLQKDMLHATNVGADALSRKELIVFCRDWFEYHEQQRLDRLAREEAWRREWSGKKGKVKNLFDRIDVDGSGEIDIDELEQALKQLPDFFGYSAGDGEEGADPSGTPAGMQDWIEDEVSGTGVQALFKRLDLDGNGKVDWEEFWSVIGQWLDDGFNRLEELRLKEQQLKEERDRQAAEEEARRKAAEEAAADAERLAKEKAEAEERRKQELANMSAAEREKAEKEAAEAAKKEEDRLRREKAEAEKAEEARLKAEADAKAGAEEEERAKATRAERAAQAEAERLAKEKADAEAAAKAAAEAEASALAQEDRDRWAAAVQAMEQAASKIMAEPEPINALERIASEALMAFREGEPGLGESGAVLSLGDTKGQLMVLASTDGGKTPCGLQAGMREPFGNDKADAVSATAHSMVAGGERQVEHDGLVLGVLVDDNGDRFGAIISGGDGGRPPAVPKPFVTMMSASLGSILGR